MRASTVERQTEYVPTIGLEVHAQLLTQSKMFCGCAADVASAPPNSRVCPICLGMPGSLPVINEEAVRKTLLTGLALGCRIPSFSKFDRKNYHYPDLMKGYQISQYDLPLCVDGRIEVEVLDDRGETGRAFRVGITRVHLEEDTARLLHRVNAQGAPYALMDVNRSGLPLMEIVSEPDLKTPEEAQLYATHLRHILRWIGASTGNMEEGSLRVDANVSVCPSDQEAFGTKVEIKNMNSFKALRAALEYEVERQVRVLKGGGRIVQETRGWVEERGVTVSQRSKEEADDYRYFPEPDLPPLIFTPEQIESYRAQLPELPYARRDRLAHDYGLSRYDAVQLTASPSTAAYFESAAEGLDNERARIAAGFIVNDLAKLLGESGIPIEDCKLTPAHLCELTELVADGTINRGIARQILPDLFQSGDSPRKLVEKLGLAVVRDESALERAIDEAIAANPKPVSDYLSGKDSALNALFGAVMKATNRQADANSVRDLLRRKLDAMKS